MKWLRSWVRGELIRLVGLVRRSERESRLEEEMQFHLEMLTERNVQAGMSPEEARRAARIAFGGRARFTEEARDQYRSRLLEELGRDVRQAIRGLHRAPAFTAAAVLTLALGIGATTVIFSVVDHVVLRPLSYEAPDRLVVVREVVRELSDVYPTMPANAGHYLEWRRRCTVCEDVAALRPIGVTLTGGGAPERLEAVRISANFFPMLGVRPQLGRLFSEAEDQPGRDEVVLLSDAFWRRRFGADPSVIGRTVTLDGRSRVVVGVLPPDFRLPKGHEMGDLVSLPDQPEVFVPLALTPREIDSPGGFDFAVVARLKPGVTLAQARSYFDALQAGIAERTPRGLTLRSALVPLYDQVVGSSGRALGLLLAAVGAVLLIVCVNLSTLLLARNASRARESAVRAALGAGRGRLVRQALTESLLLALLGGATGMILSRWGLAALLRIAPPDLPRLGEIRLDGRVLGVALLVTAVAGLVFGVLPALRFGSADPGETLRAGGRTATEGRRGLRARSALIASQVGISTVLLIACGLFVASFVRVLGVDRGFQAERALALDVVLPEQEYDTREAQARFYARALDRLHSLPGVTSTAVTSKLPLEGESFVNSLVPVDGPPPQGEPPIANLRFVSPDYFATLGIPVRRGRAFGESDRDRAVVVLSERAAAALWPGEDPIGKQVIAGDNAPPAEVVGVVADVPTSSLEEPGSLIAYLPYRKGWLGSASLLLRTSGDPGALAAPARVELGRLAPGVAVAKVRTLSQVVSESVAGRRFQLALLALFAVTALLTACIGIYGVIAHSLARRRSEIGIRMALGAHPASIHRLIVREGLRATLLGLGAGIPVSLAFGRVFGSLLFEVRPNDPVMIAGVAALLSLVVGMACYVPARRATASDVNAALRLE